MGGHVTIATGPDGRPAACKHVGTPAGVARLEREVQLLTAAAHPGVVAVTSFEVDGPNAVLVTSWVPGGSLGAEALARRPLAELAGLLASAARTAGDLHGRGLAHHRLTGDHILVAGPGQAVLCGFAEAAAGEDAHPEDDVAALGHLLAAAVEAAERAPSRSWRPGRRAPQGAGELGRRLQALAARATDPDPARRCSAASLARQLGELAGPLPDPGRTIRPRVPAVNGALSQRSRLRLVRPRGQVIAGAGLAVAFAVLALLLAPRLLGGDAAARDLVLGSTPEPVGAVTSTALPHVSTWAPAAGAAIVPGAEPVTGSTTVATAVGPASVDGVDATATRVWPPDPATTSPPSVTSTPAGADLPSGCGGEPCGRTVTPDAAGVMEVGGRRFRLDGLAPTDLVFAGRWGCAGELTLTVLHLPSGALDAFGSWPRSAGGIEGIRLTTVAGATAATPAPDANGCAGLAVTLTDGTVATVPVVLP